MKKLNQEKITGYIYSFGEANGRNMLEAKVSGPNSKTPNTPYIAGVINIATDEEGLNVIPVHFTYVTATYGSSGKANKNYDVLQRILAEGKTWITDGKDAATKVSIDGAIALNDWYKDNDLVSTKVNEGSFIEIINQLPEESERATFRVDMVITNVSHIDADEEKGTPEMAKIKGGIFNFRNEVLPIDVVVKNPQGMAYFEGLEASSSNPVFTKVWGRINCETKVTRVEEESAFGEASVRTYTRQSREWIVTGVAKAPYEFGEEEVLTAEELTKAMQDRQVKLAELKKQTDERKNGFNATSAKAAPVAAKTADFNF